MFERAAESISFHFFKLRSIESETDKIKTSGFTRSFHYAFYIEVNWAPPAMINSQHAIYAATPI